MSTGTIVVGDMTFTLDDVKANREFLIELRNEALKQSDFGSAVSLSHTIAMMAELVKYLSVEVTVVESSL